MNVAILSWFSAVLFPIHEVMSPLDRSERRSSCYKGPERPVFLHKAEQIDWERGQRTEEADQGYLPTGLEEFE